MARSFHDLPTVTQQIFANRLPGPGSTQELGAGFDQDKALPQGTWSNGGNGHSPSITQSTCYMQGNLLVQKS